MGNCCPRAAPEDAILLRGVALVDSSGGGANPASPSTAPAATEPPAAVESVDTVVPSKWDSVGCTPLKRALRNTILVDAAWLAGLARNHDVLPRCQEVPASAVVSLAEMEAWEDQFTVGVLIIS